MSTAKKPVCLVIGAGAGIGGNVAKRFAQEGYHAVLCRRSDEAGLAGMVADIEAERSRQILALSKRLFTTWAPKLAIVALQIPVTKRLRWAGGWAPLVCFD